MSQRTAKTASSARSSGKRKAAEDANEGVGTTAKKVKSVSGVTTRPRPFGPKSKVAQEDVNEDVASDGANTNKFEREHGRATTVEDYKQAIVRLRAADPNWGKVDLSPYYTEGTGVKNAKSANGVTAAVGASKLASTNVRPAGAKRKAAQDETDGTGAKKAKKVNGPGAVVGTSNAETASSNVAASKPKDVGKLQFVTTARRGGPSEYEDHHERHFREACDAFKRDDPYMLYPHDPFTDYEGYKEARRDLNDYLNGNLCCDCEDPVAETEVYKTEFDLSIRSSTGEEVGTVKLLVVDLHDAHHDTDDFFRSYENHDEYFEYKNDMVAFAGLFTNDPKDYPGRDWYSGAVLDLKIQSAGTKCWSPHEFADDVRPLVHVLNLTIKDEWRGQGIGTRVYSYLSNPKVFRGARYLFVRLGGIEPLPAGTTCGSQAFKDWAKRMRRVRAFHRRAGFRRIGNSEFFARAADPNHPSRMLKPEDDAGYVSTAKMHDVQSEALVYAYA